MADAEQDTLWYHPDRFLLPYKNHFHVCQADVIQALGLDPEDPDWEKIKWDAAQPAETEAFERLREKRESVVRG